MKKCEMCALSVTKLYKEHRRLSAAHEAKTKLYKEVLKNKNQRIHELIKINNKLGNELAEIKRKGG